MKDSFLHALNIGALALWLSVTGFATVAIWVPAFIPEITSPPAGQITEVGMDISVGKVTDSDAGKIIKPEAPLQPAPEKGEPLPPPPVMPTRAALPPLPAPPFLAAPVSRAASGMSISARLAAGRTPGPSYPPESLRERQKGTVVVQFTVDAGGRVSSVSVYSSSGWDLLDQEALRTVRSWEYPPGDRMTLVRPIVFQLP